MTYKTALAYALFNVSEDFNQNHIAIEALFQFKEWNVYSVLMSRKCVLSFSPPNAQKLKKINRTVRARTLLPSHWITVNASFHSDWVLCVLLHCLTHAK